MTREENRKLVEELRPLLELVFKSAMKSGVSVNIDAFDDGTAWLDVEDYRLLIINGSMTLSYQPNGRIPEWEYEWREDVSALVGQIEKSPSERQLQGEDVD